MTTSRRHVVGPALALVLLLAGARGAIAGDQPCPPTALLTGEKELIEAVRISLQRRGIALEARPPCPAVVVEVERATGGLHVSIQDSDGRRSERQVSDAETAAALIESWARPELGGPAYAHAPSEDEDADADAGTVPVSDSEVPEAIKPLVIYSAQPRPIGITASTTASVASDGSIWLGLEAGACVQIGPVCAGAEVRTRLDTETVGGSERYETSRIGLDLLVAVDRPFGRGRTRLRPGVGAGVGWTRIRGNPDRATTGQQIEIDTGGLRVGAHVAATFALRGALSVELAAGVDLSPLAHTGPYYDEGTTLAGEPRASVRGGIGLRYGAR